MKKDFIPNVIPHAGMRPDSRKANTGAPRPDRGSLLDEIEWRLTQQQ